MSAQIFTSNHHDSGYDLIPGADITNKRVGCVFWDNSGLDGGLIVRIYDKEYGPDNMSELDEWLAAHSYQLTTAAREAIALLVPAGLIRKEWYQQ